MENRIQFATDQELAEILANPQEMTLPPKISDFGPDHEGLQMKGEVELVLKREDSSGEVVRSTNLIVNGGFDFIANAIGVASSRPDVMSHIAIGTGSTAAAAANSALGTQTGRVAAAYAHTAATTRFTMTALFAAGTGTGNIREAGVLNASTGGIMLNRVVFAAVNKTASDSLNVTFTFSMS